MASGDLITRTYGPFRGVDFRGEEVNLARSPESLNMWKDYSKTESISTRPEIEILESFDTPVWGIFSYKAGDEDMLLVHSGTKLYKIVGGVRTEIYSGLNPARSLSFIFNEKWFFKDGLNYLVYDGTTIAEVIGYIPTTTISRNPAGGGTTYEDVNMLTSLRKNTFVGDGVSTEYYLDAQNIDSDYIPEITVDGSQVTAFVLNAAEGKITFNSAPAAPLTDGQDNVIIQFRKTVSGHRDRINKCTLLEVFDNRVFFSGNQDYPNTLWHSSLNDPSYCSDLDYYTEGMDLSKIRSLVAGNNALWVFKEPSQANTAVFYHNPTIDAEYGKIYPSTHSNISTGCVGAGINFNDDIVFFGRRGMEAINGDITTEQVIAHRSSLVDAKLTAETDYKDMILEEWSGYLLVFIGTKVYLADSRAVFTNINHYEYEWYYWELSKEVTCTKVIDGILYLGTADGVYTLTDLTSPVTSYWTTPIDRFGNPQFLKTTNKKGCVCEASGDLKLSVKTNKTEWEQVGQYNSVSDYFVGRIKKKKFKDIQIKFSSDTRFCIETATLECYVGGYIKR